MQINNQDAHGREVGKKSILNSGTTESQQVFTYNALGQLVTETVPYRSGDTAYDITRTYDLIGRPKSESRRVSEADSSTQTTTWEYNRQSVTVTDAEQHVRTSTVDGEGRSVSVQEPSPGGTTYYVYTEWGDLKSVTDANGHEITAMNYDPERGFRTGITDLDAGSSTYEYTVWGELYRARDARTGSGNWTVTNTYDQLGRLTNRVDYDPVAATSATSTWEYYTTTNSTTDARKGLLYRARSYVGDSSSTMEYEAVHKYDAVAGSQVSLLQTEVKINGAPHSSYTTDYQYDSEGRPQYLTYPTTVSSLRPRFDYAYSRGYLDTVQLTENGTTYPRYDLVSLDAVGRGTQVQLGNGVLDVQTIYDRVNLLVKEIKSGTPSLGTGTQNLAYTWDKVGNLKSRQDLNQSGTPTYLTEAFIYDALNRLDYATLNGTTNQDLDYEADGNITSKTMPDNYQFTYTYNTSGKPHAVSKVERAYACDCSTCYVTDNYTYDDAGNMLTRTGASGNRYVKWTAFSKPKEISLVNSTCTGDCTTFTYGPDRQLIKQVDTKGGTTRSIYYVGAHFEVEVNGSVTEYRSHAFANGQVVFTQVEDSGGIGWRGYYPLRDHLGSVDKQVVAMGGGSSPLVYSYDTFGRRRNDNWTNDGSGSLMVADYWNHQGYTGHEMLDTAQLVHMQGRVYDPTLGRFLSPDPAAQLGSPQSLNPYSYVANNPLSATDPSGYSSASVAQNGFWATSVDLIANGALLDVEVAIANWQQAFSGWLSTCQSAPALCHGDGVPSAAGITGAVSAAVSASTAVQSMITADLSNYWGQKAAEWAEGEAWVAQQRANDKNKAEQEKNGVPIVFIDSTLSFTVKDPETGIYWRPAGPMMAWNIDFRAFTPAGLGGGITLGENPDGSHFVVLRFGVGRGGGVAVDGYGTAPNYSPGDINDLPDLALGVSVTGFAGRGPGSIGASGQGGIDGLHYGYGGFPLSGPISLDSLEWRLGWSATVDITFVTPRGP